MKRTLQALIVGGLLAWVVLWLNGCSEETPTAPPADPLAGVYGDWFGTLTMRFDAGGITQDQVLLEISRGPVVLVTISAADYAVTSESVNASTLDITVDVFGNPMRMVADIDGNSMTGSAQIPGVATGTWVASK